MNIFARIFAPRNLAAPPATSAVGRSGLSAPGGGYSVVHATKKLDAFCAKYVTLEFLPGRIITWRGTRCHISPPPAVTQRMFNEVIQQARPFSDTDIKVMEPITNAFHKAGRDLEQYSFMRTGELIRASLPALKEALRSGQQPEATPTYEAMQDQITATRRALHEIRQEEIIKAAPIIRAGCERLYAGLQKMVREQEAGERDGIFARWKTEFRPSNALQGLIYFALCAMRPALDCSEGGAMVTPTSDPRRLWGFVIQNQPAPPLPEGTTLGEARDLARNRIDKERQKQLDREASERDQAEHRRRIAQINLVNDSIRHQSPTAEPPILPGYIARAATPRPTAEPPATQPPTPEPPPGEIPATKP